MNKNSIFGCACTYLNGTQTQLILATLHASNPGQGFNVPFSVPKGSFWQVSWGINGNLLSNFGAMIFADFSLSNAVSKEGWGVLTYST